MIEVGQSKPESKYGYPLLRFLCKVFMKLALGGTLVSGRGSAGVRADIGVWRRPVLSSRVISAITRHVR